MHMIWRVVMIGCVNTLLENVIWIRLFQRHRSLALIVFVSISHAIIQNGIIATYLIPATHNALWAQQLNAVCASVFILLAIVSFLYTYYFDDMSLIKTLACQPIVDLIMSCLLVLPLSFVNLMEGRYPLTTIIGDFRAWDLLFPILLLICLMVFLRFTDGPMNIYRHYDLKHPRFVAILLFIFYTWGIFATMDPHSVGSLSLMLAFLIFLALLFFGAIVIDHRNKAQYTMLTMSQELLEHHYHDVEESIRHIDRQRQEVEEKMAALMQNDFPEDLTKRYLEDMWERKKDLHQSLYTDYYLIDALLAMQVKQAGERVQYHFKLSFALEGISQVQLCEVLQLLFRYGETLNASDIDLQISNVAHQVIVAVNYHEPIRLSSITRGLRRIAGLTCATTLEQNTLMVAMSPS